MYGKPIRVNSGLRSPVVNRHVGGAPKSQHTKGQAADITAGKQEENKDVCLIGSILNRYRNEYDYQWDTLAM